MTAHPIFDTHAHYHDSRFKGEPFGEHTDVHALLDSLFAESIAGIVGIGTDIRTSQEAIALAEQYPHMYAAVGMYPGSIPEDTTDSVIADTLDEFRRLLSHPKAVAIGEIGFDFYYDKSTADLQRAWFDAQLTLAEEWGYPVCIHMREATDATLSMLRSHPRVTGVLHCFSGSAETAEELVKMGYYISFSGVVTYKNARKVTEAVTRIPRDRILVETDCPYLAPTPMRGKCNHSGYLVYTVGRIAELLGISPDEVADLTRENAYRFYRIGKEL